MNREQRRRRARNNQANKGRKPLGDTYFSRQEGWSTMLNVIKQHSNKVITKSDYDKIMRPPYFSFAELRMGKADDKDIAVLEQSISMTNGLIIRFHDFSNLKEEMVQMANESEIARKSLLAIAKRKLAGQSSGYAARGDELRALSRCLGILDGLVEVSTINHLSMALQHSINEVNYRREQYELRVKREKSERLV